MSNTDIDQLIDSWFKCVDEESDQATRDDHFWAYEKFQEFLNDDPQRAWEFILKVCGRRLSEKEEVLFACGPLEDFIHRHASAYIEQIERFAATEPKFAELLGGVWYRDTVPPEIWKRIEVLRGEPWGP